MRIKRFFCYILNTIMLLKFDNIRIESFTDSMKFSNRCIYNGVNILNFQLVCSDNLLRLVFLWSSSFSPYLFRLVSRFTPDWDVKPESLCNLYLLPDKRCYLSGMPLPFNTSYVPHFVKHVQRRGEHAVKVCCLPDVSDI